MKTQSKRIPTQLMPGFQDSETYRTILEALQTGVCVVDLENKIRFWNDGAERITGYLRHEVMGRSCLENIQQHCTRTSCELCGKHCPLITAIHNARPLEASGFLHHKGGHRTPVHIWAVPVRDAHGSIIGAAQSFDRRYVAPTTDRASLRHHAQGEQDESTGVANHATMLTHLTGALGTFTATQVPFGVCCLRVDDLDQLRAKYGQEAATAILRVVAQTLENTLRPTDFVGRWKEDQFLAVLPGCNESTVLSVCERVYKMVVSGSIEWWGAELFVGPISLGSATPQAGDKVEDLAQRAQQSLANWGNAKRAHAAAAAGNRGESPKG